MLGVVLCGGQSMRMGSDKGLLKLHASTWAQTAVDKITAISLPYVLSVNAQQQEAYENFFDKKLLVQDAPSLDLKGPLCGVLSVHLQYPQQDLLVLACDMPLMETALLTELIAFYEAHQPAACLFNNEGAPEPLCAVYAAAALKQVYQLYLSAKLLRHSMKFMLEQIEVAVLPLPAGKKNCFRNFNAHAELNGL